MKGELSKKADEYAEECTNRELYKEPVIDDCLSLEDYDKQRRWLQYYCHKRIEFFNLGDRRFGNEK